MHVNVCSRNAFWICSRVTTSFLCPDSSRCFNDCFNSITLCSHPLFVYLQPSFIWFSILYLQPSEFVAYEPRFEYHHFEAKSYHNQFLSGCYLLQWCTWIPNPSWKQSEYKNQNQKQNEISIQWKVSKQTP